MLGFRGLGFMVSALPSQLSFPMMNSCMKARASESCPGCRKQLFSSRKVYFGILHIVGFGVEKVEGSGFRVCYEVSVLGFRGLGFMVSALP